MKVRTQVIDTLGGPDVEIRAALREAGYVLATNESAICILQADNAREIHYGEFEHMCNEMHISLCKSSPCFHENLSSMGRVHGMIISVSVYQCVSDHISVSDH